MTAFLFAGQGSVVPGMREEVADLRPDLLDAVTEAVGDDPFARAEESTRYAQPAILCASLARWSALGAPAAEALLGHSLGELSALAAAGSLSERDALSLVALRAALMDDAGKPGDGMIAILRGELPQVQEIADAHDVTLANDNAPGQLVLAGDLERLDAAAEAAKAAGLRAVRLGVSGAFHSPAMASALPAWTQALAAVEFAAPSATVYSCLTAAPIDDPRQALADGLTSRVRFRESLLALQTQGVTHFVEVGPGKVLAGLASRTLPDATVEIAHVGTIGAHA
ncbi:MAG TPA: ACP S-malonyltransferase [Solirubrobacteraceae bacterium]|nr:ACP S-malonyltransferase [Solirubrobacteraceae bacterium]